jgi:hypothetical protein
MSNLSTEERAVFDVDRQTDPMTRIKIARAAIDTMLTRMSRIVNAMENRIDDMASIPSIVPADTFRMNLLAIASALDGETRAERIAVDDQCAATIAEILHETKKTATVTLPIETIVKARQLFGTAAMAGKEVEVATHGLTVDVKLYRPVAAAAMMLGDLLAHFVTDTENGGTDAE